MITLQLHLTIHKAPALTLALAQSYTPYNIIVPLKFTHNLTLTLALDLIFFISLCRKKKAIIVTTLTISDKIINK